MLKVQTAEKQSSRNKLWKEQLSEWGMTKNMPKSTTRWIIWNERKRKLQNKEPAKYTVAGQVIDLADIQKKAKRAKIEIDSDSDVCMLHFVT
jgi:hypothetical protein